MAKKLFLATENGLIIASKESDEWSIEDRRLEGSRLTSVSRRDEMIVVGSRTGIHLSRDGGQTWRKANDGLSIKYVRWITIHPQESDLVFAGTEPAMIFVSRDGANSWQERPEVRLLREAGNWFLPYSPESGCIRGFAFYRERIYAAAEVGGLLHSIDSGQTWSLAAGSHGIAEFVTPPDSFIHPDVHSVSVHPSSGELVYAPTGGGFFRSIDGGKTWALSHPPCYCRAVWVDPGDAEHLILGAARSVNRQGTIVETRNGGKSWITLEAGLDTPWPNSMVERFKQVDDDLFAILSNGQILVSKIGDWSWRLAIEGLSSVNALAA